MSDSTSDSKKTLSKLRNSKLSRTWDVFNMVVGSGQKALSYKIQSQFKNLSKENLALELLAKQLEMISKKLSHLKGGLMKVGQMLSVYGEYFLPPEINKSLKSLQAKSIPFEWNALSPLLEKELGSDVFKELEIHPLPLASASIGQVHRAKILKTGENIVLKIQYPGIEQAIESDLSTLNSLFKIADLFPKISHLDLLFQEVESMLKQELDYIHEMNWTQKYFQKLKSDSRFIVPQVYPDYTTSRILATSYEEGHAIDSSEISQLSQDQRNHIAFNVLELYFQELFAWGFVQTDPHIGNYKLRIDPLQSTPSLILYDFGAVREFSLEFLENYKGLIRSAYLKNYSDMELYAKNLRFVLPEDSAELKTSFYEFCILMVEPFSESPTTWHDSEGRYDWARTDLPKRLTLMVSNVIKNYSVRAPPREVVFLDRKTTGVFIFLSVLKANLNSSALLKKYLQIPS